MNEYVPAAADILIRRGETIAVAESAAGGLISAALLSFPGASAFYAGGSVVYTRVSRQVWLDLDRADVEGLKPLSEAMTLVFARRVRDKLGATWGLAELGAAGPTGTPYGHPAGRAVVALAGPVEAAAVIDTGLSDREDNMQRFTDAALLLLSETLGNLPDGV